MLGLGLTEFSTAGAVRVRVQGFRSLRLRLLDLSYSHCFSYNSMDRSSS